MFEEIILLGENHETLSSISYLNSHVPAYNIHEPNRRLTRLLSFFFFKGKPYKSSLFHIFIIRSIKRIYRCIVSNRIPKKTCIKVDLSKEIEAKYWYLLCSLYRENPEFFSNISKSTRIFSVSPNNSTDDKRAPLKYNIQSFSDFFSPELVRLCYNYLVSLIFSNPAPEELYQKLKFSCCKNSLHTEGCTNKWIKLEDFLRNDYLNCFSAPETHSITDIYLDENYL